MKRTPALVAIAGALSLASAAVAAQAASPVADQVRRPTVQTASFGAGVSPATFLLAAGLVLTGAAVVALGAWSGDTAETP